MGKFYIHNGAEQEGPFTLEELKNKNLTKDTPVWYEGITDWINASEVDELKDYFKVVPPPFSTRQTTPPPPPTNISQNSANYQNRQETNKSSSWKTLGIIIVLVIAGSLAYNFLGKKGAANIEVKINPPKPRVLNSRSETDPNTTILDYKQAVYATIYNDGGAGSILVTATVNQGKHHFEESKEIFLAENSSEEVYIMFDGPRALGGRIDYSVRAKGME